MFWGHTLRKTIKFPLKTKKIEKKHKINQKERQMFYHIPKLQKVTLIFVRSTELFSKTRFCPNPRSFPQFFTLI